jgi:hypothetical protein
VSVVALALLVVVALAGVPLPVSAHLNDVNADAQVSSDRTVVAETAFLAEDGFIAVFADAEHTEMLCYRKLPADGSQNDSPSASTPSTGPSSTRRRSTSRS